MAGKRHKPEETISKLRQVDVQHSQGTSMANAIRQFGVTEVTYYRWQQEYGGLKTDQVRRFKELEKENLRMRKAVSDWRCPLLALSRHKRRLGECPLSGVKRTFT
jgi:transposase